MIIIPKPIRFDSSATKRSGRKFVRWTYETEVTARNVRARQRDG